MVVTLLNTVQELRSELNAVRQENQVLRDEINRLKGEQGRPTFKKKKGLQPKPKSGPPSKTDGKVKMSSKREIPIDREEYLELNRSALPPDAVFKGYKRTVQQNLCLVRKNVAYYAEVYYSKSTGKSYRAPLPPCCQGAFGAELLSLTQVLHHYCDVTHSRLKALYDTVDLKVSKASISNMLLKHGEWAIAQREAILKAGLEHSPYAQIDGTESKEKGKAQSTQIVCAEHFKTFFTRAQHKRYDIISILQGKSDQTALMCFNRIALYFMKLLNVTPYDQSVVAKYLKEGESFSFDEVWLRLNQDERLSKAKTARRSKLNDSLALGHYFTQKAYPLVKYLLSDEANEYGKIGRYGNALCWVHDARHYRKLNPCSSYHQRLLKEFMAEYWSLYNRFKAYREEGLTQQKLLKPSLEEAFDKLFNVCSDYGELNKRMKRTYSNRKELLAFLEHPLLPLHNNSAERGARRVVRKRDISLHSMSAKGTLVRDSFLSIVETARKLGVNVLEYIEQEVRENTDHKKLAVLVAEAYSK